MFFLFSCNCFSLYKKKQKQQQTNDEIRGMTNFVFGLIILQIGAKTSEVFSGGASAPLFGRCFQIFNNNRGEWCVYVFILLCVCVCVCDTS